MGYIKCVFLSQQVGPVQHSWFEMLTHVDLYPYKVTLQRCTLVYKLY